MTNSHSRVGGFSLLEIAVVVVIVAVIAAILAPLIAGFADVDRSVQSFDMARRIHTGIVGNPNTGYLGYLGDVGTNPDTLLDLVRDPGREGWNGPYVTDVFIDNNVLLDGFGGPLEYYYQGAATATTDLLTIISRGPDRGSTNTSATPNSWASYAGAPLPSAASYSSVLANRDNLVYPRFTDNAGLLSYQSVGQFNLNVLNYDYNTNVSAYVPACPNLYWVKVTSVTRPSDTFAAAYTPGGASFDLIQGIYRVQLLNTTTRGIFWDDVVTVAPGTSQNRTVHAPSVDSTTTPTYTLTVNNNVGATVTIYNFGTNVGTVANAMSGSVSVRGCSQITLRRTGDTKAVVDNFVTPMDVATYTRRVDLAPANYTVTNKSGRYRYLLVYMNNLLLGEVSGWGNRKVKVFRNTRAGEVLTILDQSGINRATVNPLPGTGSTTL